MLRILLSEEQLRLVTHGLTGNGGFQRLIGRLQAGIRFVPGLGWTVQFSPDDGRRVIRYADESYGDGTYQKILRSIEPDVRRAMENEPPDLILDL